jgi:signal peptidase complex subunit 3
MDRSLPSPAGESITSIPGDLQRRSCSGLASIPAQHPQQTSSFHFTPPSPPPEALLSPLPYVSNIPPLPASLPPRATLTHSHRGRHSRWKVEDLASLRFDVRTDLQPLLESYNTKQLFLHLTASYDEAPSSTSGTRHDVVLWDRIITRGDMRDFRAVGKKLSTSNHGKRRRGNLRVEEAKNKYVWKQPSGTFK